MVRHRSSTYRDSGRLWARSLSNEKSIGARYPQFMTNKLTGSFNFLFPVVLFLTFVGNALILIKRFAET